MSRFTGQEIREEITEGGREEDGGLLLLSAPYNVYMHQYIVEHVCLLMSSRSY